MKSLYTCLMLLAGISIFAQNDPISLSYDIGKFKITPAQNRAIHERFTELDPNKTYLVHISGSADFLGDKENNITLSNKRVKFAEYHLLQYFSNQRLIIKLDSKGEMNAKDLAQTSKGIQQHRMVYINIQEYDPNIAVANTDMQGIDRVVATSAATNAEDLPGIPKSVLTASTDDNFQSINTTNDEPSTEIKGLSETAQIERARQASQNAANNNENSSSLVTGTLVNNDHRSEGLRAAEPTSDALEVNGDGELKKFDSEGTFTVGERLLLSDMNFRPGSHYLRPSSIPSLRNLIDVLIDNPTLSIEIRGHICCHPDYSVHPDGYDREAGNHKLSYNRAQNIKEYLEKNGIASGRVIAVGMGAKERLVFPEETDEDRIKNRRVEVIIRKI